MAVNKKNYNKNIKVSESVVAQLRKGTKASNIAKANAPGASAEFREAVRRFYGKDVTKAMPMASGKTIKSGPRRVTSAPSKTQASKPRSGKTSNMSPASSGSGAPEYKMNTGKSNLTPAQRQAIAARQSTSDKVIGTAAQLLVPGTLGFKAVKAGQAGYKAAVIAKNTRILQTATGSKAALAQAKIGKAKGLATKKEVQQIKSAVSSKKSGAKKPTTKTPSKPKVAPKTKAPVKSDAQEMSKKVLDRVAGKRPNRRLAAVTVVGYGAKERYKIAKGK